ncbi:hypothetical protein COT86_01600 [Candidatus Collierbacteria bacterium CG10_big_fil_rev_8_21_14_0_10_43_36]|uniref:Uncharacterized protein n=3 Tax=Candidatus Collieribacteriota TaxID=1752725 RepID=A0A2H0DVC4_9BACT|nr:MAG: hypothetical protein COW83_00545 [Candidatus Collierbacteria bacterium CG22_combo_CG10-13_8_21_14_all_43_12]PIR99872.1 MAG: hypothetical protein COT86_01600 [Candidatus Collierbacteria bacterium CG10_big_fil_rev_8_21_14_0_10_43_36]PIZ24573.1 MAG: hypothetical protein COY48_02185 [Candidatus Collierbacteria bacterium CG_4_10_14_0_8_um_filter_43_86]PJB47165.1 MAG: hypothetical protein CO104_04310 [Candidatus Collierbacteria bacterium CG_4_9_14_3_um_filter_43_16]
MPRGIKNTTNVSDKNTKQEILSAYQQLATSVIEGETAENFDEKIQLVKRGFEVDTNTVVSDVTKTVTGAVEQVEKKLNEALNFIEEVRKAGENQKRELIKIKEESEKERIRKEEEFDYGFRIRKERQELELTEANRKVETDLKQRQEVLKAQEEELESLRGQVKMFEARMQKTVNDAVAVALKDQKIELEHLRAIENAESKSKNNLLEQQVVNDGKTIETLRSEITRLNGVLVETTSQMTRIAEKAVSRVEQYVTAPANKTMP